MPANTVVSKEGFFWLDLVQPTPEELKDLASKYDLPAGSVEACLDPEHLPKFETIENLNFLILRASDEDAASDADTIQELTRKTAFFFSTQFLITIHRKDQPHFIRIREKWRKMPLEKLAAPGSRILSDLLTAMINSYEQPIDNALDQLELFEMGVFEAKGARPFEIQQGYYLKRKAFVFKRMLRLTTDLLPKVSGFFKAVENQKHKETADTLYFYTDELMESINSLLNLHISLSSQKTNEVVRVLTIFSVFLLPLNVVTGIYGMNFEHMPELKWAFGYPLAITSMVVILLVIYLWFHRRGWLR